MKRFGNLFHGKNFKKVLMFAMVAGIFIANASAAGTIGALDSFGDKLLALCTSKWLKAILAVMLMISVGVAAYGNSQGSSQMVQNALRWAIGTAVILAGTSVVKYFFNGVQMEGLSYVIGNGASGDVLTTVTRFIPPLA